MEETENSNYIEAYNEDKGTDEMYQEYLSTSDRKVGNLENAIAELVRINDNFLKNVLMKLKYDFAEKNEEPLLQEQFFPNLYLNELISLHEDLRREFQILPFCYDQIYKVFENTRDKFLVYCSYNAGAGKIIQFLKDQQTFNQSVR